MIIPLRGRAILWLKVMASLLVVGCMGVAAEPEIQLARVPNGGLQPQALIDGAGTIHLLYFKGKPNGGDLFYVRQTAGAAAWSAPLRVNSEPNSAMAMGSIRGGQLARGRAGRLHVVWNGSQRASQHKGVPFLYSRLEPGQAAFEPQRDLIHFAVGLDGGGSIAADQLGNVQAFWHGVGQGDADDENDRRVFLAKSTNDGATFGQETPVSPGIEGVCACCGLRGLADDQGRVLILYRAVAERTNRNSTLILSRDGGRSFTPVHTHPWTVATCPMSSSWLAATPGGILAAWETAGRVFAARLDEAGGNLTEFFQPEGHANQKHPVLVANRQGDRLLVWVEGTGWEKGGGVAWQRLDFQGRSSGPSERKEGVPVWSFAAAVARPDGRFLILY